MGIWVIDGGGVVRGWRVFVLYVPVCAFESLLRAYFLRGKHVPKFWWEVDSPPPTCKTRNNS